jgi:hypothetical protein
MVPDIAPRSFGLEPPVDCQELVKEYLRLGMKGVVV